ncbi:MAG: VanZ family protein [Chloroflexota bacterium]
MTIHGKQISLHAVVLLIVGGIVIALTTLPTSVSIIAMLRNLDKVVGHPNATDALGHGTLYGTFTAVIYWALRGRIGFRRAFWVALFGAMSIGLTTELLQHFSPGRSVQLSDLLGNWLGVMTVIALIGYHHSLANERLQKTA